jgi:hypothetical protein
MKTLQTFVYFIQTYIRLIITTNFIIWNHIRTTQYKELSLSFYETCLMMPYK